MTAALFLASAAFVLYVLFGYPALLAVLARFRSRPISRRPIWPAVTIILPVRDGEAWLRGKLGSILGLDYPPRLMQILVVSDGSTDSTDAIAAEFADRGVELVRIERAGKAEALNAGMRRATGEILFFTDVRQRLDSAALKRLVECFADPKVGVASGELIILEGQTQQEADTGLYWRYEKWIRKRLSAIDSVIGATGCIYAMRRELAVPLPPDTLNDDMHLPLAAFFRGYRIILDDSARAYDVPASLRTEFQRKVRTLAGVYQLVGAYPALLGPGNRMWVHFVSHKLARLLLPFALVLLAVASVGLPGPWPVISWFCQAGFYACAAATLVSPRALH